MSASSALRDEIRNLRYAIDAIKRDLPPADYVETEGELMSFRPANVRESATETEDNFVHTEGTFREDEIQQDLQAIKSKIDGLKLAFSQTEEAAPPASRQSQLQRELERLREENRALKQLLQTKAKPRRKSAKIRRRDPQNLCENCAFLQAKGFESDLCYRHRAEIYGKRPARMRK